MGIHRVCYLVKWHDTKQTDLGKLKGWMKCRWKGARVCFQISSPKDLAQDAAASPARPKKREAVEALQRRFIHPKFF